ncbi:probable proteasome subunit beta type-2 isoform X1 [Drosophila busckii]|uniref:probable proteasome subunit beta type-2 isoform X1 n=2 Tax=Drosophila busckii TaxID=30019 RepID=UPI001432CC55|nr:probable proteasome subunit beta type-2 isoform X1 [Drosophila busckii]
MDSILGIKGKDFVLLAADTTLIKSFFIINNDQSKIRSINKYNVICVASADGDALQLVEFVEKNAKLYEIRSGYAMSTKTLSHFARNRLVRNLSRKAGTVISLLVAGCDPIEEPRLYHIDAQGAEHKLNFCSIGMSNVVCASIFRMMWRPNLTYSEALAILKRCIAEIQKRMALNLVSFDIILIDKDGIAKKETVKKG